jgi:hypothetical protein
MGDQLEEYVEFDPLSVVPDDRFRAAFCQLKDADSRVHHCQLGSTGGNIVTVEFTPEQTSDTSVQRKVFRCQHDSGRRASSCEFARETAYHLGDPAQVFRVSDDVEPSEAIKLMRLLANRTFRSEVSGFPPGDWPDEWWARHSGRYLGRAVHKPGAHRFELSLAGCACRQHLVLEYGSLRTRSEVVIVDQFMQCI